MPIPATAALRAFLLLATFSGTQRQVSRAVRGVRSWWSGKKIAVIGPTASGKDSFLARLRDREIPELHASSPIGEKVKSFKVKLALSHGQAIDISCKGVINTGGDPEFRDDAAGWRAVCQDADVIFYVMTIEDLARKRFQRGRRVRDDLEWLFTVLPHVRAGALVHILVNKVDLEIESHTDYTELAVELAKELRALDRTVHQVLHPYDAQYTGATLISMKNKQIYTRAIQDALRAIYGAFHETETRHAA